MPRSSWRGPAYLAYLGIKQWRSRQPLFVRSAPASAVPGVGSVGLFVRGALVSATNPKAIVFFTALLPQFVPHEGLDPGRFVLLTAIFAGCTLFAHTLYAFCVGRASRWLADGGRVRTFNRVTALVFFGLGAGVLRTRQFTG